MNWSWLQSDWDKRDWVRERLRDWEIEREREKKKRRPGMWYKVLTTIRIHTVHSYEISVDDCVVSWFVGGCTVNEISWNIITNCLWCGYRLWITVWTAIVINFIWIVAANGNEEKENFKKIFNKYCMLFKSSMDQAWKKKLVRWQHNANSSDWNWAPSIGQ